jgi:hypothetical protein
MGSWRMEAGLGEGGGKDIEIVKGIWAGMPVHVQENFDKRDKKKHR